ncbi:LPD38 domain-containing protein [Aeromonas allosaccharophila]|uniref:LPD38 domain-containing protein n=1 Tax=Aeromonas allosaccharophila TaxID=656 RepID=UPI00300780E2
MAETNEFDAYWDNKLRQRDLNVGLGDVARGVGAGALDLVGGIGELARQASQFGKENAGKQGGDYLEQARANMASKLSPVLDVVAGAGDLAKSGAESLTEGMSGDAKEAIGRSLIDETPEGRLTMGDGAGDLDVWAMKMAQGVGSMVPTLLAGGVTGAAAKASIGRAVTTSMLKRGATQEVAEAVAAKTVAKLATGAAVTTGATGSVGSAVVNTRESVLGMSFDELSRSDTFRQAFTRIDQDQQTQHLSDEEKLALAREETANLASRATMSDAKTWGAAAMGSMMGDAMLFKMLAGKAATGGVLKGAAKGAMGEGVGETLEEGIQQYAVNESLNEVAAADIDPMKGVMSSAIEGGLIGMGAGGAVGAVGGARGSKHAGPEEDVGTDPVSEPSATVTEEAAGPAGDPVSAFGPQEGGEQAPSATQAEGDLNPLGPSGSQFDELRDVPAYLRQDDTADRYKGMAADSEVQRALAGEFGQTVQDLVATQMQAGDQGKSLYERAQAGELGVDPFAGNKSAQQVAMENQRLALPLKDVIFAGDANAKPKGKAVAAPGDHDDRQAGTGPQYRGNKRTHWQSGQEGDLLPPEAATANPAGELPGAVIEGEASEVGNELPHRNVVYGNDLRAEQQRAADLARRERELNNQPLKIGQSETLFAGGTPGADPRNSAYTPPKLSRDQVDTSMGEQSTRDPRSPVAQSIEQAGSATDSVFGPLQTLRITRKGKPFATEKEATMASRKGQEMPVPLNGGGFGVAEIAEVEQVKAAATTQSSAPQLDDISVTNPNQPSDQPAASVSAETVPAPSATAGEASQLAPAIDTGYREVIPGNQPQAEVSNEPVTPVPAISSEGQRDQPGAGEPAAAGAGPAVAGLTDRAGSGDRADLAAPAPVPDGQQQNDPTLTAPATDAGAAVSGRIGEEELRDRDLLKEHGGHWKYRSAVGAGWFTANTKEAAIERAEEAYRKAVSKGEPVPTRDERFAQADAELFSEMDRRYGKMSTPELEAEYQRLGGEVGDLQKSGSGEFNGNGGRRTGAAVSNEGARQVGEERLRLGVYMKMRRDRDTAGSGAKSQQIEPANDWRGGDLFGLAGARNNHGAAPSVPRSGDASAAKGAGGVTEGRLELDGVSIRIPAIDEEQQRLYNQATHRGQGVNFASGISTGVGRILNDLKDAGLLDTAEQRAAAEAEVQAWANEEAINARKLMRDGIKTPSWVITGRSGRKAQSSAATERENNRQTQHYKDQDARIKALRDELKKLRPKEVIGRESFNYAWGKAKGMIAEYASALSGGQPNLLASLRKSMNSELARYLQAMGKIDAQGFIKTLSEQDNRLKAAGYDGLVAIVGARSNPGKIISDAINGRIRFSKQAMAQGEKPAKHLTRKEAELVTKEWFKQYRGASGIDVQIHATQAELEKALGLAAQDGLIRRAAFDDDSGTLHVAADTIANPKRMREILRHEVLAHYGLANVLGDGEYTKLISRIIKSKNAPSMKAVWDWVDTHYAGEDVGVQAEEVIAHLAELEQSAWRRGWDQVVAWVTKALRTVGFVPGGITAAETRALIEGLGKKMKRGGPDNGGPDGGHKFSQESEQPAKKGGIKMSQANTAADKAMEKLNLGPKPDIIDKTKANLDKLRKVDRGVVESWVDRFIKKANTEVLDALAPIKYAEDAAGITDAADSGYVAARMATGAASTMQATMLYGLPEWKDGVIQRKAGTGEKDALLGIFADLGADLHNWLGWMAGHRAELLLAQGRENLLDANDIAALKGQGKGKEAKFLDAKARWNRLNAATLDLAQEAGLFTKEARAEFESEWYIPFFRESDDGDVIAPFKTKGIANQNSGIKKLKGGEANTNDLLENIFTSTSKLIDASMKNMAAQKTVWNLADTGIIEVIPKPNKMDYQALANGKDRIMVKLEGEDYMIRVEDPDLYRAMTFFDRKPFSAMVNVAAKAKRLLTAGVTASPEFMLRNFLRDSLSSWAISKDGFRPVIDSIKGVKKTLAMDGSTIDVMFSGASFLGGYVNGNDPEAMADTVRKSLRRKGMTPEQIARYEKSIIRNAAQAKGVVANVWEKYNRYGEAFENANREAVYAAAIKAGKSHAQAAFESKDLMDFSMLGASRTMQVMTQLLPFFNARVQGLGKLSRELRDNPREIAKRAGMITAASLALLAANWDDERYEELPDWDKDANWHFFVGDQHFRIPKPFEIGVLFGTIPERMVRALGDKDTGAQFGKAVARAIGDTFALNPIPQIAKPVVETTVNYDFFKGGPIDGPQDLNVQAEARYNEQTSLLMRELGELTGFSPKQLEHLVIGYTGTMGSYVMAAADGLIRASRPGESASWRADEIPLVKAVYRGTDPAKSTQHMEEFYRMLNEVNQLKRTVDQYRSEGLTDKANELLEEQGGILKSRRSLSRTQQQVRVVRNRIELIQRDRTLTAEEKRRRIDEMLARRNDLVYQAVNKNKANWE